MTTHKTEYMSSIVNDVDADVVCRSSDGLLFHVHRKNLEVCTGGFPLEAFWAGNRRQVRLPETAEVLEILFTFIYPRQHPDLAGLRFSLLTQIADAAEKYEVFAAKNICATRMK